MKTSVSAPIHNVTGAGETIKMFLHSYTGSMKDSLLLLKSVVSELRNKKNVRPGDRSLCVITTTVTGMESKIEDLRLCLENGKGSFSQKR